MPELRRTAGGKVCGVNTLTRDPLNRLNILLLCLNYPFVRPNIWPPSSVEKKIGWLELLEHYLARIERFNPQLNAIVAMTADNARERARQADQALALGSITWRTHDG